jgi:hypothetical protein
MRLTDLFNNNDWLLRLSRSGLRNDDHPSSSVRRGNWLRVENWVLVYNKSLSSVMVILAYMSRHVSFLESLAAVLAVKIVLVHYKGLTKYRHLLLWSL